MLRWKLIKNLIFFSLLSLVLEEKMYIKILYFLVQLLYIKPGIVRISNPEFHNCKCLMYWIYFHDPASLWHSHQNKSRGRAVDRPSQWWERPHRYDTCLVIERVKLSFYVTCSDVWWQYKYNIVSNLILSLNHDFCHKWKYCVKIQNFWCTKVQWQFIYSGLVWSFLLLMFGCYIDIISFPLLLII